MVVAAVGSVSEIGTPLSVRLSTRDELVGTGVVPEHSIAADASTAAAVRARPGTPMTCTFSVLAKAAGRRSGRSPRGLCPW
jgi:hypothetical protein